MAVPVTTVAARGAAATGGHMSVPRGSVSSSRVRVPLPQKVAAASQVGERNDTQRVRQVQRNVRSGRVRDRQGRSIQHAQFTGEKPSALLYLGVSMIALLKDLLDLVGIGSLPAIGTVVTLCFTFLIWILLATFDRSSQNTRGNMHLVRGLVVIFFGLVEAVGFGLNFLPIETAMVIVLYQLAKRAWRTQQQSVT